jgi:PhzF family phenazine biosynthesis protein
MKFYIIDAFADEIFGGNPAGVVLLEKGTEFPNNEIMLKTAAELRYSETAFVLPTAGNEFRLRYFTPAAEVDFCGHATIASFTALMKAGLAEKNSSYKIHTLSGELTIDVAEDSILMGMPASEIIKRITLLEEVKELYKSLGIEYTPVFAGNVELLPILISTGFPDIIMPVKDRQTLAGISPDFKYLSFLSEKHGAGGVHAFTLDAPEGITACCRNFAPLYDIDEEAATGTANGGLTYYLHIHGLAPSGYGCSFLQGEAMGRPSKISSSVNVASGQVEVKVGGRGVILAEGEIYTIPH